MTSPEQSRRFFRGESIDYMCQTMTQGDIRGHVQASDSTYLANMSSKDTLLCIQRYEETGETFLFFESDANGGRVYYTRYRPVPCSEEIPDAEFLDWFTCGGRPLELWKQQDNMIVVQPCGSYTDAYIPYRQTLIDGSVFVKTLYGDYEAVCIFQEQATQYTYVVDLE